MKTSKLLTPALLAIAASGFALSAQAEGYRSMQPVQGPQYATPEYASPTPATAPPRYLIVEDDRADQRYTGTSRTPSGLPSTGAPGTGWKLVSLPVSPRL